MQSKSLSHLSPVDFVLLFCYYTRIMMRYIRYALVLALLIKASFILYAKFKEAEFNLPVMLQEANKTFLLFVALAQIFCYIGDGWLSKILLEIAGFRVKLKTAVQIAILDVLGNQLVPFIGANVVTYAFYKRLKVSLHAIVFLTTAWTILNLITSSSLAIGAFLFAPASLLQVVSFPKILLLGTLGILEFAFLIFFIKKRWQPLLFLIDLFVRILNILGTLIRKKEFVNPLKLRSFVMHLADTTEVLGTNKLKILKALFASFLFYVADIATLYFSFLVFGFRPPLAILVFGFIISTAIALFTLMPETPGIMETSLTVVFVALQFPPHVALLASLLFRLFTFWVPLALGIGVYIKLKKTTSLSS